jgi:Trk-type K+ transport system membrane component
MFKRNVYIFISLFICFIFCWFMSLFIAVNHMHGFSYIYGMQRVSCLQAVSAVCFTVGTTTTTSSAYENTTLYYQYCSSWNCCHIPYNILLTKIVLECG